MLIALVRRDLRLRKWQRPMVTLVLMLGTAIVWGLDHLSSRVLRDDLDIFSQFLSSPVQLLAPVFAVVAGCLPLFDELGKRFIVSTRTRVDLSTYLCAKIVSGCSLTFLVFFGFTLALFVLAYGIWPSLGNPNVDPSMYGLTEMSAQVDAASRVTYSGLLRFSPLAYGVVFSGWVGVGGATLAGLGMVALVALPSRLLAILIPFIVYTGGTVAASLLGVPHFGIMFSIFPFGLTAAPPLAGAAGCLVLALLTLVAGTLLLRNARTSLRLA